MLASLSGSYDRSKNSDKQTSYHNSTINADQIHLRTSGDTTTIFGGNVHAESQLTANIGGDLQVESRQNTSRSRNNGAGISAGMSLGGTGAGDNWRGANDVGGVSGVNGGINASSGNQYSRETVLSSLTSGGRADITVAGDTRLTGALLATVDDSGNDQDQLNLDTGTLHYTDLHNRA